MLHKWDFHSFYVCEHYFWEQSNHLHKIAYTLTDTLDAKFSTCLNGRNNVSKQKPKLAELSLSAIDNLYYNLENQNLKMYIHMLFSVLGEIFVSFNVFVPYRAVKTSTDAFV